MTTAPDPAPAAAGAAPGAGGPPAADGGMGDKVDVRSLAAQRPGEAMWLLVTEVDGPAGGGIRREHRARPAAARLRR